MTGPVCQAHQTIARVPATVCEPRRMTGIQPPEGKGHSGAYCGYQRDGRAHVAKLKGVLAASNLMAQNLALAIQPH